MDLVDGVELEDVKHALLPMLIEGRLQQISSDCKVVVIAENWPSWLVTLIALDIPNQAAYFSKAYHCYFKSKYEISQWQWSVVSDLVRTLVDHSVFYLVSGDLRFVQKLTAHHLVGSFGSLLIHCVY